MAVQYLLDCRLCNHHHIDFAIKASRRVKAADIKNTLTLAEKLIAKIFDEGAVKRAMLSLIGLWGKPYSAEWHIERTRVMDDMDRVTMVGVDVQGVPPTHKAHTVVLNNHSTMPVDSCTCCAKKQFG